MLSTLLVYLCTELVGFLEGWHAFDRVGIPLYRAGIPMDRVEILSREWECLRHGWNAFASAGIPLYRVGMLPTGLE
jgi:hypothetical protein